MAAPVLNSAFSPSLGIILENVGNPAGISVAQMVVNGSITDPDPNGMVEAIAITALNNSRGYWQYSVDNGAIWRTIFADLINSTTNELALLLGPTALIRLVPFGELSGPLSAAMMFRAWDRSAGSEGEYAIITATGNNTPYSKVFDTASIAVTPVNDIPTFAPFVGTGKVVTNFGGSSNDRAYSFAVQPDGMIVVAGDTNAYFTTGYDLALARYKIDGSLDVAGFSGGTVGAKVALDQEGRSVILQPDGFILVAGFTFSAGGTADFVLTRFDTHGVPDPLFGNLGTVVTPIAAALHELGQSVIVQPDGHIVVAGYAASGGNDFAIARYLRNGDPDLSWNGTGILPTSLLASGDQGYSVLVQADGGIALAGYSNRHGTYDFTLARYDATGTLLSNVTTDFGNTFDLGYSVTLMLDGKMIVAGSTTSAGISNFAIARYTPLGVLDANNPLSPFGANASDVANSTGLVITDIGLATDDQGRSVTIYPDGRILVAGYTKTVGGDEDFALTRYRSNGTLDHSFGTGGKVITDLGANTPDRAYSVTVQPDGKIVVAGYTYPNANFDFAVARYLESGAPDLSFGGAAVNTLGGTVTYTAGGLAVALDTTVNVFDVELAALNNGLGNYGGAMLILGRSTGIMHEDQLTSSAIQGSSTTVPNGPVVGDLVFDPANPTTYVGEVLSTVTAGNLAIKFWPNTTQSQVDAVLDSIKYVDCRANLTPLS